MVIVKLPVEIAQVGCVTALNVGADGVIGCASTVTDNDDPDVQVPFEAVNVYDPAGAVIVFPDLVTPVAGLIT